MYNDLLFTHQRFFLPGKLKEGFREKTVKPFLVDKVSTQSKTTFAENSSNFAEDEKVTTTLDTLFIKAEVFGILDNATWTPF